MGFWSGLGRFPVSGLDHILAMVAVGLWGAQLGPPAVWLLPVTFPIVMAFGGMLGLVGGNCPASRFALRCQPSPWDSWFCARPNRTFRAAAFLVGFFAIFHGHAHGTELPTGANAVLYSIGFVIATGTLHAVGSRLVRSTAGRKGGWLYESSAAW